MDPLSGIENSDPDSNCSFSNLKKKFRVKGFQIILQRFDVALHFIDAKAVSDNSATLLDCSQTDIEYPLELETIGTAFQIKENSTETSVYLEETGEVLPIQKDPLSTQKDPLSEENCTSNFEADESYESCTDDEYKPSSDTVSNSDNDFEEPVSKRKRILCNTKQKSFTSTKSDRLSLRKSVSETHSLNLNEKLNSEEENTLKKTYCCICSQSFFPKCRVFTYAIWIRKSNKTKLFTLCAVCNQKFSKTMYEFSLLQKISSKNSLAVISEHMKKSNGSCERLWSCNICSQSFPLQELLIEHACWHNIKPLLCNICMQLFFTETEMKEHMAVHENEMADTSALKKDCRNNFKTDKNNISTHENKRVDTSARKKNGINNLKIDVGHIIRNHLQKEPICNTPNSCSPNRTRSEKYCHEKKFLCSICGTRLSSSRTLEEHMMTHNKEKPFICDMCDKGFIQKKHLKRHIRLHLNGKEHQCTVCKKVLSDKLSLKEHILAHHGVKPFRCSECEKTYVRRTQLKKHMWVHTGLKPYPCDICYKRFTSNDHMQTHRRIHTGDKPFLCEICSKSFSRKGILNSHLKYHNNERAYQCRECDCSYITSSALRNHVLTSHRCERLFFACSVCDKQFPNKTRLKNHEATHTGDTVRTHCCWYCNKAFPDLNRLQRHMLVHTSEQPFHCSYCNRAFNQASSMKRHLRIHTNEKPYTCATCGRSFIQKGSLEVHCKSHMKDSISAPNSSAKKKKTTCKIRMKNDKETKISENDAENCVESNADSSMNGEENHNNSIKAF